MKTWILATIMLMATTASASKPSLPDFFICKIFGTVNTNTRVDRKLVIQRGTKATNLEFNGYRLYITIDWNGDGLTGVSYKGIPYVMDLSLWTLTGDRGSNSEGSIFSVNMVQFSDFSKSDQLEADCHPDGKYMD